MILNFIVPRLYLRKKKEKKINKTMQIEEQENLKSLDLKKKGNFESQIDQYDEKMLNYIVNLYNVLNKDKINIEEFKNSVEALQYFNAKGQYNYLENLLKPEYCKGVKIPSPVPVPSTSFQLHNSVTLSTNSSGNLAIVFNPFFLYDINGLGEVGVNWNGFSKIKLNWLSSLFVNNDDSLDGHTPSANTLYWKPVNIGQGIPSVYDQYRLVSASIVVKYIGRLDSVSGVIGGAIVFDEERYIGASETLSNNESSYNYLVGGPWLKKYANFDLAMDSFYHQENMCLEGIRELYFPIDNTFEEYMKTMNVNYMQFSPSSNSNFDANFISDQDYYKSGFNQMIYVLGAPANSACFKLDIFCNFECLPNAEFLNYMPISNIPVNVSANEKKEALMIVQKKPIMKQNETDALVRIEPKETIWEKLKKKFSGYLPNVGQMIAWGIGNMLPSLKPGLALAGTLINNGNKLNLIDNVE